ncbi:MAG: hypothetical protein ABIO79_02845 [Ferruginibacter sp.]
MYKLPVCIALFLFVMMSSHSVAQNVGISTTTPTAKLQINNDGYTRPALKLFDSAANLGTPAIHFQNAGGNKFWQLGGNMYDGNPGSSYFDIYNSQAGNYLLTVRGDGNVGIGNSSPVNKLDVSGDVNLTGAIKTNGNAGAAGQFLRSNGGGSMSWTNSSFQNQAVFSVTAFPGTAGDYNWTVPAGITKIEVELWSAGGHGGYGHGNDSLIVNDVFKTTGGGGGAGGYASALLAVTPGQVLAIHVPAGGEGGYAAITNGGNAIYLNNGYDGSNAFGSGGFGGNFGGTTGSFTNVSWLKGENGAYYTVFHDSYVYSSIITRENTGSYGDGGSSPNSNGRGTGGFRNEVIEQNGTFTSRRFVLRNGSNGGFPGGGGGGGFSPSDPGPSGLYSYPVRGLGAGGMVVIHF